MDNFVFYCVIYFILVYNIDMQINYYIKNVYGNNLIYVADEATAIIIRRLTNSKSITLEDIDSLEKLGCKLVQVLAPINK